MYGIFLNLLLDNRSWGFGSGIGLWGGLGGLFGGMVSW